MSVTVSLSESETLSLTGLGSDSELSLTGSSFFFGVRIWLVRTFNYPVLWVRVKGQV